MLFVSIQNISAQIITTMVILANAVGFQTTLNSLDGINLFYNLTTKTFNLDLFYLTVLVFFFLKKKKLQNIVLINIILIKNDVSTPEFFNIINYTKSNTGLINPLGQYHPPLLFFFLLLYAGLRYNNIYIYLKNSSIKSNFTGLPLFFISFALSMWWAVQELFWGGYWNWDPVEFSLLILCLLVLWDVHHVAKNNSYFYQKPITPLYLATLTFIFIINRGPLANSVHAFSNSFFLNIDYTWYVLILTVVIVSICTSSINVYKEPLVYKKSKSGILLFTVVFFALSVSYIITYGFFFKNNTKNEIFLGLLSVPILLGTLKWKKLHVSAIHILAIFTALLLLVLNEAPTKNLYINITDCFCGQTYLTDQYVLNSTNYKNHSLYWITYWKTAPKHYAHSSVVDHTLIWSFSKYNNNVSFFFLDNRDLKKLFWLFIYFIKKKLKI